MSIFNANTSGITPLVLFCFLLSGCGSSSQPEPPLSRAAEAGNGNAARSGSNVRRPELTRDQQLEQADLAAQQGNFDAAEKVFTGLLVANPQDVEVIFRLAHVNAAKGNLAAGVELLSAIPEDHPEAGMPALGQSADWCMQLERYAEAEQRYKALLRQAPDVAMVHRRLAQLLNRQGRRHEAAEHIRELCRQGNVRQDELHALIVLSDAMVSELDPSDPSSVDYRPIGASGLARKEFTEHRYVEAAETLRETVEADDAAPAVIAFYGRIVAEAQDDERFHWWLGRTDPTTQQFAEYWAALGAYLVAQRQFEPAVRALLEALDRDPTDFISINRLLKALKALDSRDEYALWEDRWKSLNSALTANNKIPQANTANVEAIDDLASHLNSIDRSLEAVMWKSLESHYRALPPEAMNHWNQQRQQLVSSGRGFPGPESRICGMDKEAYPLPKIEIQSTSASVRRSAGASQPQPASFRNVAAEIGLDHAYRVTPDDRQFGFTMYHQTGGGVAVLDYDRDGFPDLYFAQGSAEAPEFRSREPNILYRSLGGKLQDITSPALDEPQRYTIGCTSGDWNQDGFADLLVANIGPGYLLINNGDGTFATHPLEGSDSLQRMPASIAMADLNGDHLPDIFEANYIDDETIAREPSVDDNGNVLEAVGPGDFSPSINRIGIGDGRGGVTFQPIEAGADQAQESLGVVIANFDSSGGNDIFVGNDKAPNQFWVRDASAETWSDVATLNGTALSDGGASTASMGIATADFDHDATPDFHITNFQNESVCLYLNRGDYFQDRAIQYRLGPVSRSVLGFGSQPIDYDNDGNLDLVVTNGHIEKALNIDAPFKQPVQLFCNLVGRFDLVDVEDASGYWAEMHLGRALARLDFNRDGRNDFVVTHISERSALLTNETESKHHWIQVDLAGTTSERDSIGAKVQIRTGQRKQTEWMLGGDGYLCRNEPVISFGLGEATVVDEITVHWPSGTKQSFRNVAGDRRWLIVENQPQPFPLDASGE